MSTTALRRHEPEKKLHGQCVSSECVIGLKEMHPWFQGFSIPSQYHGWTWQLWMTKLLMRQGCFNGSLGYCMISLRNWIGWTDAAVRNEPADVDDFHDTASGILKLTSLHYFCDACLFWRDLYKGSNYEALLPSSPNRTWYAMESSFFSQPPIAWPFTLKGVYRGECFGFCVILKLQKDLLDDLRGSARCR